MTDVVSLNVIHVNPVWASPTGQSQCATVTNTVSAGSWFTSRKSVKSTNFDCPSQVQICIKFDTDKRVTNYNPICNKHAASSILCQTSTCLPLHITPITLSTLELNFCVNYQKLLTLLPTYTLRITYLLTYLLTPWCRVLLEKLTGLQLVKKFPAFHGTRRFITALTSVRHLSLSWASPIQSIYPHPTSWRFILILSIHLRLGLPSGLLPSGFPTKTLYTSLSSPIRATSYSSRFYHPHNIGWAVQII